MNRRSLLGAMLAPLSATAIAAVPAAKKSAPAVVDPLVARIAPIAQRIMDEHAKSVAMFANKGTPMVSVFRDHENHHFIKVILDVYIKQNRGVSLADLNPSENVTMAVSKATAIAIFMAMEWSDEKIERYLRFQFKKQSWGAYELWARTPCIVNEWTEEGEQA